MIYSKSQLTDLLKFKKHFVLSYLDNKDNLPKKIGIIGHKYNACYFAAIELAFKYVRYRSKIRSYFLKGFKGKSLLEIEENLKRGNKDFETIFNKYFIIVYSENITSLRDSLNTGAIDFLIIPTRVRTEKRNNLYDIKQFKKFTIKNDFLLSASLVYKCGRVVLCSKKNSAQIKKLYTTEINSCFVKDAIEQDLIAKDCEIIICDHTQNCINEASYSNGETAFFCSEEYYNLVLLNEDIKSQSLHNSVSYIEFRMYKAKINNKDDQKKPKSIHRLFKQAMYYFWKQNSLKAGFTIVISFILYLYSIGLANKSDVYQFLGVIDIPLKNIISLFFSFIIFGVFYLLHIKVKTRMRLNKVKGYWLLYAVPSIKWNNHTRIKELKLYEFPRIATISVSADGRHLNFEIRMLNYEDVFLSSNEFYLDVIDSKSAGIVLKYSNDNNHESQKLHGRIKGIASMKTNLIYESSNVYEMEGNFFSQTRIELGQLKYFRLSDKEDFELLRNSEFLSAWETKAGYAHIPVGDKKGIQKLKSNPSGQPAI